MPRGKNKVLATRRSGKGRIDGTVREQSTRRRVGMFKGRKRKDKMGRAREAKGEEE